jgi:soluble lytic murein transglycosylase-like protein
VLSYSALYDLALQAGWPADRADEVARVAYCESRYRPGAVGYGTYGLMQLVPLWFTASGTDFNLWSDPLTNLKVALYAFETDMSYGNDAWAPWSCKPWKITLP